MQKSGAPTGIIAIVRLRHRKATDEVLRSLVAGGVESVEVTLGTPGSLGTLSSWRRAGGARVGMGSIRTALDASLAIDAGAQFLVTPTTMLPVLEIAEKARVPVVCGALTPTEIDTAWQHGATAIKIFPIDMVGGLDYVRALQGPIPDIPLLPTGGVDPLKAKDYAALGCVGVGVGSALVAEDTVTAGDWITLETRAASFIEAWREGVRARHEGVS